MSARRWWVAAVGLAALLAGGCSIGDIRRPVPTRPPASPEASPGPDEVRESRLPVPADYTQQQVTFVDRLRGYALFIHCGPVGVPGEPGPSECSAMLFGTADGGRSWQPVRHPQPIARNHQIYARYSFLLLLAEPHGWYVSYDRGVRFDHESSSTGQPPDEYFLLFGALDIDENGRLVDLFADPPWPVSKEPPVPRLNTVLSTRGQSLFVAGVHEGRPYAAVSADEGRTWRQTPVPEPGGEIYTVRLARSVDGDVWLFGYASDGPTSFPWLWRYAADRWEAVAAVGHPEQVNSVVPIGGGMLAAVGPNGSGVVTAGRYADPGWPLRAGFMTALDDGTLVAVQPDGAVWLGEGHGTERRWTKIVLARM